MKINRTLFVVLLAGFLFGLATSQVKGRAQDITPTLPPPTFKWDLEIELTEEAVLVIQADTSIMEKQLDDQNTHMEISGNMLHLSGEESLEQVRQVAFEALAPFIDFLGGPTPITAKPSPSVWKRASPPVIPGKWFPRMVSVSIPSASLLSPHVTRVTVPHNCKPWLCNLMFLARAYCNWSTIAPLSRTRLFAPV